MAKGRFREAIEAWYDDFDLGGRFSRYSAEKAHNVEQDVSAENKEVLKLLETIDTGDDELNKYFKKVAKPDKPIFLAIMIPAVIGFVMAIIQGIAQPITQQVTYGINRLISPARLDPFLWLQAKRRGLLGTGSESDDLDDLGWNVARREHLDNATKIRPGLNELIVLLRRKEITQDEFLASLSEEGVDTNKAEEFVSARQVDPGLSDLLNIAVREAYDERAIREFELNADFPDEFAKDAREIGVRDKWPELLWRAHWKLPGVGQSFEMFQRLRPGRVEKPFTVETLETYLRTADIAPFFRPLLTAIAFRPPRNKLIITAFFALLYTP